jgi:chemosensory pili system protein ChpC
MTTATAVANEPSEMSCVLIPLEDGQLLLPSVCIAEIMPWRRIKVLPEAPEWCLGLLGWRGEAVPVMRFEHLNGTRTDGRRAGRCLVVMNRSGAGPTAFYALAVEGLPRLVQLTESDLGAQSGRPGPAEGSRVRVGAEDAIIPSLGFLEQQVAALPLGR